MPEPAEKPELIEISNALELLFASEIARMREIVSLIRAEPAPSSEDQRKLEDEYNRLGFEIFNALVRV